MLSGEIHYWRLPGVGRSRCARPALHAPHARCARPALHAALHTPRALRGSQRGRWDAVLASAKRLGVEVIGTYIPWQFHETSEGSYDFWLLEAFLDAVERHGFRIFARPGPYIYAEWRNLGIPDHATPYHKLHPEFQRKAAHWIAAVMNVLKPRLGKSIIAVQADNEIDPMPHYYGEDQGYADWLRARYQTIERLNATWGTRYRDFAEPLPALAPVILDVGDCGAGAADSEVRRCAAERRFADGCQYRYDLATRYAEWVIAQYRRNGCDVPIVLNTYPGVDAQNWRDLAERADLFGIDVYPRNECRGRSFYALLQRLRLLRCVTNTPMLVEFGSGIWHGMSDRDYTPDHYRLTTMAALAGGVRGWNWYMLADRDNWHGAPINQRGVIRPALGEVFTDAVRAFNELKDAPPPETSCAVAWSWRFHQAAQLKGLEPEDPLLAVLHEMGIEHDFVDVQRDFDPPPLLLVAGAIDEPQRLWRYVEQGGRLALFQRLIPGCAPPDGTSHPGPQRLEVSLGFVSEGPVFAYRRVPGTPITAKNVWLPGDEDTRRMAELALGRRYTTGYHERRGRGTVLVLGCPPSRAAVLAVHRFFKIDIPVLPLTPGVHASKRGDKIIVLNPGEAKTAKLQVGDAVRYVDLPRCAGAILTL